GGGGTMIRKERAEHLVTEILLRFLGEEGRSVCESLLSKTEPHLQLGQVTRCRILVAFINDIDQLGEQCFGSISLAASMPDSGLAQLQREVSLRVPVLVDDLQCLFVTGLEGKDVDSLPPGLAALELS